MKPWRSYSRMAFSLRAFTDSPIRLRVFLTGPGHNLFYGLVSDQLPASGRGDPRGNQFDLSFDARCRCADHADRYAFYRQYKIKRHTVKASTPPLLGVSGAAPLIERRAEGVWIFGECRESQLPPHPPIIWGSDHRLYHDPAF